MSDIKSVLLSDKPGVFCLWLLAISLLALVCCSPARKLKPTQGQVDSMQIAKSQIPTIPNPPPMPSQSTELGCLAISQCKTYRDVDNILRAAFDANTEERYYFNFQGGFAVSTAIDAIDNNGVVQFSQNNRSGQESGLTAIFTGVGTHLAQLFLGRTDYHRFILIIVSPNLNKIGGYTRSEEEDKAWFVSKYTKVPDLIVDKHLPPGTAVYALMYEFKKNGNADASDQLFGAKCISRIDNLNLILSICNSQRQEKN